MNIYITGGSGFIGSNLVEYLNSVGIVPTIILRRYETAFFGATWKNLRGLSFKTVYSEEISPQDDAVLVHLSANASTKSDMDAKLIESNINYLKNLYPYRFKKVIYASSAATYGNEEKNFAERTTDIAPMNAYGMTKLILDNNYSDKFIGLRFFNVYGPREAHKADMMSLVSLLLIANPKVIKLFKSERPDIRHGEQARDFVYVGDVCKIIFALINSKVESGIYNVGTGQARTFNDLAKAVYPNKEIEYVDMPHILKDKYQYYTCADITKLKSALGHVSFLSLEDGVNLTREFYEKAKKDTAVF